MHESLLLDALAQAGQPLTAPLQFDKFQRYGGKSNPCWLKATRTTDGHIVASFGDFRHGTRHTFQSWDATTTPLHDAAAIQRELDERKRQQVAQDAIKADKAQATAQAIMERGAAHGAHPYLDRKDMALPDDWRLFADGGGAFIAVPMYDLNTGELRSIQRIYGNGNKRFLSGTQRKDRALCSPFGFGFNDEITHLIICEGAATAAAIHQATNQPVLIAFDASGLLAAAQAARHRWPEADLTIAADNDAWQTVNIGLDKATTAAQASDARLAVPEFEGLNTTGKPTDFDDLCKLAGLDETRRQLTDAPLATFALTGNLNTDLQRLAESPSTENLHKLSARHVWRIPHEHTTDTLAAAIHQATGIDLNTITQSVDTAHRCITQLFDHTPLLAPEATAASIVELAIAQRDQIIFVSALHGLGKTQWVLQPIADHFRRQTGVIAVTPFQSLTAQAARQLGLVDYRDFRAAGGGDDLAVCINSIERFESAFQGSSGYGAGAILIDEVARIIDDLHNPNSTHGTAAKQRLDYLCKALARPDVIAVCVDADLEQRHVEIIRAAVNAERDRCGLPHKPIKSYRMPGQCNNTMTLHTNRKATAAVLEALADGERILFCSDSAKAVASLAELIKQHHPECNLLAIHNDTGIATAGNPDSQAFMADINREALKYDVVLYSPAVTSGVSLETPHFTQHICQYHGVVTPQAFNQQLMRDRTAQHWDGYIVGHGTRHGRDAQATNPLAVLNALRLTVQLEMQGMQLALSEYDTTCITLRCTQNAARNHYLAALHSLLTERGWQITFADRSTHRTTELDCTARRQRDAAQAAAIVSAPVIDDEQADELDRSYSRTTEQDAALAAYHVRQSLGIATDDPAELTLIQVLLWNDGHLTRRLRNFESLFTDPSSEPDLTVPAALQPLRKTKATVLRRIVAELGLNDDLTGEITTATARRLWHTLHDDDELSAVVRYFDLCPLNHEPDRPIDWLNGLMRTLGLEFERIGQRRFNGQRQHVYRLMSQPKLTTSGRPRSYGLDFMMDTTAMRAALSHKLPLSNAEYGTVTPHDRLLRAAA